jgi:hypothetical protein
MPNLGYQRLVQRVARLRFEEAQKRDRSAYLLAEGLKARAARLSGG